MCVSCGSFGLDEEGRLISCTQCGQSYHSYCAGLNKVTKHIYSK
jgi:histone-lysine N-methyltransferase MLL3